MKADYWLEEYNVGLLEKRYNVSWSQTEDVCCVVGDEYIIEFKNSDLLVASFQIVFETRIGYFCERHENNLMTMNKSCKKRGKIKVYTVYLP